LCLRVEGGRGRWPQTVGSTVQKVQGCLGAHILARFGRPAFVCRHMPRGALCAGTLVLLMDFETGRSKASGCMGWACRHPVVEQCDHQRGSLVEHTRHPGTMKHMSTTCSCCLCTHLSMLPPNVSHTRTTAH